jgi:ribosomal protein S12 methylthiotransferase accessory factor
VTTGVAAHPERAQAVLNGLLEVIERDAVMLTWLTRVTGEALDLDTTDDAELRDLVARFTAAGLVVSATRLLTDVPVAAVAAAVEDPTGVGPALAFGSAAALSLETATRKAVMEAFTAWRFVRERHESGAMSPPDAATLDQQGRLLWWAEPARRGDVAWLLDGPRVAMKTESCTGSRDALGALLEWFRAAGEDVIAVDLTDAASVEQLGHHVMAVVVPGFHPMHLCESAPALWSRRLERVAGGPLNPSPHPFP